MWHVSASDLTHYQLLLLNYDLTLWESLELLLDFQMTLFLLRRDLAKPIQIQILELSFPLVGLDFSLSAMKPVQSETLLARAQ